MVSLPAVTLYMAGLAFAEALRLPRRMERRSARRLRYTCGAPRDRLDGVVMAVVIVGIWVLPLIYACTSRLQPFDYRLPSWIIWVGAGIFTLSLLVRLSAQRTLGRQWSGTVEAPEEHRLVTTGLYRRVRHPIYASLLLWATAQPALVPNWVAGWGGPLAVALLWFVRVPREERMMFREFGDQYASYVARTGRLLPKHGQRRRRT